MTQNHRAVDGIRPSRRTVLRAIGGLGVAGAVGGPAADAGAAIDGAWRQWAHDARNTGHGEGHTGPGRDGVAVAWSWATGNSVWGTPVVADGMVYGTNGRKEVFVALDASDGAERWSYPATIPQPALFDGTVYGGDLDGTVYALRAEDGTEQWTTRLHEYEAISITMTNDALYAGSTGGTLYALDPADGTSRWSYSTGAFIAGPPAVANGSVFVASADGSLFALAAGTGRERWSFDVGGSETIGPVVADGLVFVGNERGEFSALEAASGAERWSFTDPMPGVHIPSGIAVANGLVYIAAEKLSALRSTTGAPVWTATDINHHCWPTVVDDVVYVGNTTLQAFDADTGEQLWEHSVSPTGTPAVLDGTIYVYSQGRNELLGGAELLALRSQGQGGSDTDTDTSGDGASVALTNVRLVQTVENTRYEHLDTEASATRFAYDVVGDRLMPDDAVSPDLVAGKRGTVVFDVDVSDPAELPDEVPVDITWTAPDGARQSRRTIRIHRDAFQPGRLYTLDGPAPLLDVYKEEPALFEGLYPIFEITRGMTVDVSISGEGIDGDTARIDVGPGGDVEPVEMPPLRIGFVPLERAGDYEFGLRDLWELRRFAMAAARYVQRTFPTTRVVGYFLDRILTGDPGGIRELKHCDARKAKRQLERAIAADDSDGVAFAVEAGSISHTPTVSSIDVAVGLVPLGYFDNEQGGGYPNLGWNFARFNTGVLARVGSPSLVAHEIAHYFAGVNVYDGALTREGNSFHAANGVRSTKYIVDDIEFGVEGNVRSFMSPGGGWIDAVMYQALIESEFEPSAVSVPGADYSVCWRFTGLPELF